MKGPLAILVIAASFLAACVGCVLEDVDEDRDVAVVCGIVFICLVLYCLKCVGVRLLGEIDETDVT